MRLDQTPSGALLGHARETLNLWGNVLGNPKKRHESGPNDWAAWMESLKKAHTAPPAK